MSAVPRSQRSRNRQLAAETAETPRVQNEDAVQDPAPATTTTTDTSAASNSHPSLTQEETLDILMQLSGGADSQRQTNGTAATASLDDTGAAQSRGLAPAASDASSSLSELDDDLDDQEEVLADHQEHVSSADEDTEAETERLDISPEKSRALATAQAHAGLNRQAARDNDHMEMSDDEQSADEGAAIAIQPLGADTTKGKNLTSAEAASRKRKRTASFGEGLRRRTGPKRLGEHKHPDTDDHMDADQDDDDLSDLPGEVEDEEEDDEEEAAEKEEMEAAIKSPASEKAVDDDAESSGRELSEPPEDADVQPAAIPDAIEEAEDAAEAEAAEGEGEGEGEGEEDEAETAAKSEDELARKMVAMDALKPIENLFAIFRDKLYDERLAALSAELELLQNSDCQHQDYLEMQRTLTARREEKIELEQTTLKYKFEACQRKIVAERAQMHSQFQQSIREAREQHMSRLNTRFSRIQQERRQFNSPKVQYGYKFETARAKQLENQRAYNKAVSLMSGMAKYRGFPAAPEVVKPQQAAIDDDLKKMRVNTKPQHFNPNLQLTNIRLEETVRDENWLERNSWANPNHPTLQQARLNAGVGAGVMDGTYNTPGRRADVQYGAGSGSTIPFASDPPDQPASSPFEQMKRRNMDRAQRPDGVEPQVNGRKPLSPGEKRRVLGVEYGQHGGGEESFNREGGLASDGLFTGGERVGVR